MSAARPPQLRLAVLGAQGTGKTRLVSELAQALTACGTRCGISDGCADDRPAEVLISDGTALQSALLTPFPAPAPALWEQAIALQHSYHLTLLAGLDLAAPAPQAHQVRQDASLRQALSDLGLPYQVIYGRQQERSRNALSALLRLPAAASLPGFSALQGLVGRWRDESVLNKPWRCEHCSDGGCEHRLFSRLIRA